MATVLQADQTYFAQLGETVDDPSRLIDFEERKANAEDPLPTLDAEEDLSVPEPGFSLTFGRSFLQPIAGRYTIGTLGCGWVTNWDINATVNDEGTVTIQGGDDSRTFFATDHGYVGLPGDLGTLTKGGALSA